ncbi:glycoside hydrolase family 16 protein [Chiua virens]|nr:glycoside hydrolase family 16 protein [Chiua virens]
MFKSTLSFWTAVALTASVEAQGASYTISASLSGQSFLNAFEWQAIADPTNGDVNYVDQATAQADGLYSINGNTVTLRADDTTVLDGSVGRNSFRLQSQNQYSTHVAIWDIGHMPEGCGTWPALWFVILVFGLKMSEELGADWPNEGEIDMLEGVNNQSPNQATLHTSANCMMPAQETMTGTIVTTDCDVYDNNNSGCGVGFADNNSFGPGFNNVGGGWYALERSATYVSIWFWERGSSSVPSEVTSPGSTIDTSTWGEPSAYFPDTDCDFSTHLGPMNIMIDLTFCGDWAGSSSVYAASGCPSTCTDYVNENPSAFSNAYFEFNTLNIYE